ncbi:major facilitator superfamily domain-containing protein [Abortiporus biennis]|nr:major facilitator superfamily domain-containing protein [Abortiporus biennis]
MIITYRYLRGQYKARQARKQQEANGGVPTSEDTNSQSPQFSTSDGSPSAPQQQIDPEEAAAQPARKRSNLKYKLILMLGLALPIFLETLDYTIVATAQVSIASVFNRLDLQSYIGTIYLLTSTVFLPFFASVADVFGRHISLQISLLLFLVGSAISTGAMNMPTMLAGRGVAGAGAAGMLAAVRIILTDTRSLDDNNWQQSMLFILYTIGFCVGPFIGGSLLSVSFRWIFAINLPTAVLAMFIAFFLLRNRVKVGKASQSQLEVDGDDNYIPPPKPTFLRKLLCIDWIGAFLFIAGGILILLALNWGSTQEWGTAKVIACFVVGGVTIIAFLIWQYILDRHERSIDDNIKNSVFYTEPMIPLQLFKSFNLCAVQFATFVSGMIMLVMFYFVAIFMTIVFGYSPSKAGAQLIYFAPGMGGGSLLAISLIRTFRQPKWPIILGGIVSTISLGLISMAMQNNDQGEINGFMAMAGVGVGLSMGPLAVHARFSQPEHRVAVVSGLSLFFRSLGGTVGLAQCGAILNAKVQHYISKALSSSSISPSDAQSISSLTSSSSGGISSIGSISSLSPAAQSVIQNAFRQGTKWCFISLIPWVGLATLITFFLSNVKDRVRNDGTGVGAAGMGGVSGMGGVVGSASRRGTNQTNLDEGSKEEKSGRVPVEREFASGKQSDGRLPGSNEKTRV